MACGGGGSDDPDAGGDDDDPDAQVAPDAGPSCTASTIGEQDFDGSSGDGAFISFAAPGIEDLGDGGAVIWRVELYGGIETSLAGTFDLASGAQDNYRTCALCVRVFSLDADGAVARQFYQSGGSITLSEDPLLTNHLLGTITNLTVEEVTIAKDYTSTPVDGGECLDYNNLTLDADDVPNAWTCAVDAYNDGATCDCNCGLSDPDCGITDAPVVGCTGTQICPADDCIDLCDSLATPPVGCTTGTCGFQTATQDICYTDPTLVDAAILGGTCGADALLCAVVNTVATGLCDTFIGGDNVCRHTCDATADCAGTEICAPIGGIDPKGVCIQPPANDTCQTATPLVIGVGATGSTVGGTSNYNAGLNAGCTGFDMPGADTAYLLTLTAGQAVTVTLSGVSASFDPAIALVGPGAATVCDANPVVCLVGADAGLGGGNETFNFTATDAGTYYVIVDSYTTSSPGAYTLTVTAQ